ncbi:hypothetical protein A9995_15635 [Erythrobacter sp. QSSC1-22B]|nr:hypothetical protein A9995_15635 [Erythrobacter sp. QSSC1-22B]
MRSRAALRVRPSGVRDLIEAGLSEPADALATYGISSATLVPGDWAWVLRCRHTGDDDAELSANVEVIDAPIGNLG